MAQRNYNFEPVTIQFLGQFQQAQWATQSTVMTAPLTVSHNGQSVQGQVNCSGERMQAQMAKMQELAQSGQQFYADVKVGQKGTTITPKWSLWPGQTWENRSGGGGNNYSSNQGNQGDPGGNGQPTQQNYDGGSVYQERKEQYFNNKLSLDVKEARMTHAHAVAQNDIALARIQAEMRSGVHANYAHMAANAVDSMLAGATEVSVSQVENILDAMSQWVDRKTRNFMEANPIMANPLSAPKPPAPQPAPQPAPPPAAQPVQQPVQQDDPFADLPY